MTQSHIPTMEHDAYDGNQLDKWLLNVSLMELIRSTTKMEPFLESKSYHSDVYRAKQWPPFSSLKVLTL